MPEPVKEVLLGISGMSAKILLAKPLDLFEGGVAVIKVEGLHSFFDPGVYRKGLKESESKEQDTVCDLVSDAWMGKKGCMRFRVGFLAKACKFIFIN